MGDIFLPRATLRLHGVIHIQDLRSYYCKTIMLDAFTDKLFKTVKVELLLISKTITQAPGWETMPAIQTTSVPAKSKHVSSLSSSTTDEVITRAFPGTKYDCRGSGMCVTIIIPLKNNTSRQIDVEFPAGLIFEAVDEAYQHGILLKKTKVSVPAGATYRFGLFLYCCNAHKHGSDPSAKYLKPVITTSKLLLNLCDLVKNKRINIEEYIAKESEYLQITYNLQDMVWKLTDEGEMLDKADLDYIAGLPDSSK